MTKIRVAAIQMLSTTDVDTNLDSARRLIAAGAAQGARLMVLPEMFACWGSERAREIGEAERTAAGPLRSFLSAQAREHGLLLVGGTLPVAGEDTAGRPHARCYLHGEDGVELAYYDKIHLFDADLPDAQQRYAESDRYAPGQRVVSAPTSVGELGLAVCYDLRFPELFRILFQREVHIIALPSAFTRVTGAAHWHVLLRARAIENLSFVIGAGQGGRHSATRETWGGSAIIDPWGEVLASAATGEAVVIADIDTDRIEQCRRRLPVSSHQRIFVAD